MEPIVINIAEDFSKTPGARYVNEGPYSGEEFYRTILKPGFEKAVKNNNKISIILDGTAGFATSFLDETFGQLSREFGKEIVLNTISLISNNDPLLIDEIKDEYISLHYKTNRKR